MRRAFPAALVAICLLTAGCAATSGIAASTPGQTPSGSYIPTPATTPSEGAPTADDDLTPQDSPEAAPLPEPAPSETRGPNDVNPERYASSAVDTQNGNIPLPGVSFRTEDGRTICGILTWGHLSSQAGTVSCTIDSYREVIPQPADREPFVKSVMADPQNGSYFLYPDRFAQPARDIPVLMDGETIRFEGTVCSVDPEGVTCTISSTGRGFTISPSAYNTF